MALSLDGTTGISATGNITGGNVIASGSLIVGSFAPASLATAGNVTGGNILTAGIMSSTGNAIHGNLTVSTGNITGGNLILSGAITDSAQLDIQTSAANANIVLTPNGTGNVNISSNIMPISANATANIGSATASFNTGFLKSTTAQYADLAELYSADAKYAPGTVLKFGGNNEVTISTVSSDSRVAGVVSTNPAHLMNSTLDAEHTVALALQGRVPTQVTGTVRKGDMMVSAGNGQSHASAAPAMGTVIGKALQDFDGVSGTIEIVVGRL
ncbi:hypothetical protein [Haliscomenobacter sp.]|uniref:hypothetical protein n=1 Tax=Haliscomenobacter sp. TaxID=2717303 RepID=UPI003364D61D